MMIIFLETGRLFINYGPEVSDELETVYIYEGTSEIASIEIDEETTNAIGVVMWNAPWWGGPEEEYLDGITGIYSDVEIIDAEAMLKCLYGDGNKLKFKTEEGATESENSGASGFVWGLNGIVGVKIHFLDGSVDTDIIDFELINYSECLAEGTQITLADRTTKAIEDITYEDELLVWDFDKGEFATSKPLWLMKVHTTYAYNLLKFDNGSELKTIDQHRIFNKERGKFTYPMTDESPIGTTTFTDEGKETKLVSKEVVVERVNYYNIISDYHINVFANGILTSCRFNNLYKIKDMKFEKDDRKLVAKEEYPNVPEEYYKGLRLAEQPRDVNRGNDVSHANSIEDHILNVYMEMAIN